MPVVLYERQRQILDFIIQFIQKNGYSPTLQDIADAMGLSSLATVHEHIKRLCQKGVLKKTGKGKQRALEVVDKNLADIGEGVKVPILGFFSEGAKIEAYSQPNAFAAVPPQMIPGKNRYFVLEIADNLLEDEGILEEDKLVLEENAEVEDGDLVIAILEKQIAVLKRMFKETTRVRLEPIRTEKNPIYTTRLKVQGRLTGLLRHF